MSVFLFPLSISLFFHFFVILLSLLAIFFSISVFFLLCSQSGHLSLYIFIFFYFSESCIVFLSLLLPHTFALSFPVLSHIQFFPITTPNVHSFSPLLSPACIISSLLSPPITILFSSLCHLLYSPTYVLSPIIIYFFSPRCFP